VRTFSVRAVLAPLWRPLLGTILMAEAMWLVVHDGGSDAGWNAVVQVLIGGTVGLIVYLAVLLILRVPEVAFIARRLPGAHPSSPVPSSAAGGPPRNVSDEVAAEITV
jgi:hypothetical protein